MLAGSSLGSSGSEFTLKRRGKNGLIKMVDQLRALAASPLRPHKRTFARETSYRSEVIGTNPGAFRVQ